MGRRVVLLWLLGGSLAHAALPSIGFVAPNEDPRYTNLLRGLRQGLHDAGPGPAGMVIVERRVARGDVASAADATAAMTAAGVAVVFVVGTELTRQVRAAGSAVPIVFITPGDPVRAGLAASLARPGNRLTGMTFEFAELSAKRLELLKEIVPTARRVGVVYDRGDASPQQGFAAARTAAARLGLQLVELDVATLSRGAHRPPVGKLDGLLLIPGGAIATVMDAAIKLAAAQRIATVGWARGSTDPDTTLSYGVNDVDVARNAARLVLRVSSGQEAGDMPIEQPTKFELTVNLKTAKALGLTIPQALLQRADEVIQ